MEDEDGEGKIIDMWNILEEQRLKDSTLGNALRHSIDDVYTDVIEEKQLIRYNSIIAKESARNTVANPKFTGFKGFKKRILAQAREVHTSTPKNSTPETQHPNARAGKDRRTEGKRERKITEYAQCLGLQPSARYKCSKCQAWSVCGSNTKQNSCTCNPSMTPMPSTSESSTPMSHSASNFKITRKVYLCAACGTYFENWNLFLHMRDIHKRHICLYCLGMFGQAERLSYHLMKKHNVPEMAFTSVEDFYNAFKGSCYLVCCSCERVFSETDDFFDHYCSLALKQDATETETPVCTICRQSAGTHASTCSFALSSDTDRELYGSGTPLSVADATHTGNASPAAILPLEKTTNLGGRGPPRKIIKHNKSKHSGGDGAQNFRQQRSIASAKKLGTKTPCNESQLNRNLDIQRELTNNLPRDTVTETIMEVSRYTGDLSDENDENDEQAMNKDVYNNRDRELAETLPAQNCQLDRNEPYDSVTETIMEVSRYIGEDKNEKEDSTCIIDECTSRTGEKMNIENNEMCDKSDIDLARSSSSRPPSPAQWKTEETRDTKTNATTCDPDIEAEFHAYNSPENAQSPVNRSLFSPQHESHALDPQSKEKEHVDNIEKNEEEKPVKPCAAESQASVSFNAVVTSDTSLVIKICNRNSQFSVATTTTVSKKSEENNNAQGSTSNKMLNGSKMERNINGGDEANNMLEDSDSDSDKLAVVDSNPEEDEEAEDGEEVEEADEEMEGDKCNDARDDDENQGNEEGNGGIGTETNTDRESFAVTPMPSHDVGIEKFVNNDTEDTARSVVSDQTDQRRDGTIDVDGIALAGEDAPCIDLNVEGTLDSMELEELLKRCIEAASPICVYCNHARHIAINGKQLGLHMLAEHKFQPQHPAIIIQMEQFTTRVRRSLDELEFRYFNLNTYTSTDGTYNVPAVLIYECFHCRFHSAIHKELYLHNRKMHQKTILICIMCKSTFYSYSELLCHLCPGVYSPNVNLRYRCCLCSVASLPSAFRLMVHLRKRHHVCDVCLESTGNQQRLSNHVWKHKLHHLCYRCGIAYRNKPDITKHLFWKHGTESVLCRKCLQKKWPHIYHFCIPPTAFVCEECGLSFGRAVALKVHKRLHSGDSPYGCDECTERFISRKLLAKHQAAHREPKSKDIDVNMMEIVHTPPTERDEKSDIVASTIDGIAVVGTGVTGVETTKNVKEAVKRVVDVYDLPPLNLSSESDTDSEEEKVASTEKLLEKEKIAEDAAEKKTTETTEELSVVVADDVAALNNDIVEVERNEEEKKQEARIMDGIWDNFKTYAASLDVEESAKNIALKESVPETDAAYLRSIIFADHDYFVVYSSDKEKNDEAQAISKDDDVKDECDGVKSKRSPSPGTPNRNAGCDSDANKRKAKTPKKKKRSGSTSSTSDSSSDTDSSSCSCGTNCSCSSSSSGSSSSSSSSSDSDSSTSESSPRKQSSNRKEKHSKKEKEAAPEDKLQSVEPENKPEVTVENGLVIPEITSEPPTIVAKPLLRESDLETEETETDEDFYDEHPQLLANKLLSEKRNQLQVLAAVAPASAPIPALTPAMEQPSTPLNNGILDAEKALPEPIVMTTEDHQQPQQQQKRKTKTKKRRKGERGGKRNATTTVSTVESIKLNIPKTFYRKNPGFVASSSPAMLHPNSRSSTPNQLPAVTCNDHYSSIGGAMEMMQQQQQQQQHTSITTVIGVPNQHISASGPETENKRVSKRKRVPKRFYGDSSDDEPQDKHPAFSRWRKVEVSASPLTFASPPPPPPPTAMTSPNPRSIVSPRYSSGGKTITQTYGNRSQVVQMEQVASQQQAVLPETLPRVIAPASATESDDPAESSSDSSESEDQTEDQTKINQMKNNLTMPPSINASAVERPGKIYCYCRCPYDEVSEMIACDGEDCRIEWFHFECVGIMVPPKGKWYCPDCRKKHGIVQNNEEYCD